MSSGSRNLILVLLAFCITLQLGSTCFGESQVTKQMQLLSTHFGITVAAAAGKFLERTIYGTICGASPDYADLEDYSELLAEEFLAFPKALVARTQLKRVVLCSSLRYEGQLRQRFPTSAITCFTST